MGYYASGDTRKMTQTSEDDEGYENQSSSTAISIVPLNQSDVRDKQYLNLGTVSYCRRESAIFTLKKLEFKTPGPVSSVSDDTDRPFWAEDELSSVESRQQLNKKQKRRRSSSYRNRIAVQRSRSLLFQSSSSSLDSISERVSPGGTTLQPALSLIFLSLCMLFLILSTWNFNSTTDRTVSTHALYLNSRCSLLNTVSDKFLSFGLDTSLLRDPKSFPLLNRKFLNLASHLAPAYVRIGGTSADCLYFNQTTDIIYKKINSPVDGQDISNFTINEELLESIYEFARESKLRMIFDLNVLIRKPNNSWDDVNAKNIISFAKHKNMSLDWQLGNEPNSFYHVFNRTVTATQLANDYCRLRQLLNDLGYNESILVGPEVNHVGDENHMGEIYAKRFLKNDNDSVDYVTWHQYYLNGRVATVHDFINVSTFNYLPKQIKSMKEAIKSSGKAVPMWLSETSTAYGGGAPELSDRFVAGFLWLDKLGYSASAGVNVVTRQSLFGGNYAMIGPDLLPNPDWWVSVIYKQFVSNKVLQLSTSNVGYVRLYAHCTPESALISRFPAITIYGINIEKFPVSINIEGIPVFEDSAKVFMYALTSNDLQSRKIRMNGKVLQLQPNGNLPPFRPVILEPSGPISLPPYSMVFIVLHGAKVPACYM